MKNECSVVRDLLPLYAEDLVSEETKEYIKEHVSCCKECKIQCDDLTNANKKIGENKQVEAQVNKDVLSLKKLKGKIIKKRIITVIVSVILTLMSIFTALNLIPPTIDYGESEIFSKQDMDSAIELIKAEFSSWKGVKLYSISYSGDGNSIRELEYRKEVANGEVIYTEYIVFTMQFRSPIFGGGSWSANRRYNWNWYLARVQGGSWVIIDWGAG